MQRQSKMKEIPEHSEKNILDLRDCLQDVINDAANRGRGSSIEVMSALSSMLIKTSVEAGIDIEDFMEGIEVLYMVQTGWEGGEPEVLH